jgi:hypothetical protein
MSLAASSSEALVPEYQAIRHPATSLGATLSWLLFGRCAVRTPTERMNVLTEDFRDFFAIPLGKSRDNALNCDTTISFRVPSNSQFTVIQSFEWASVNKQKHGVTFQKPDVCWHLTVSVFWDITPCSPLEVNRRFRGTCRLHLHGRRISQARK